MSEVSNNAPIDQSGLLKTLRAGFSTPLGIRHPEFLIAAARATGGALLRKDSGIHVTLPTGENVSQDILVFGNIGVDILTDGEGRASVVWNVKENEVFDASRLVHVDGNGTTPDGPGPTGGDPEPVPVAGLTAAEVEQAIKGALVPFDERLTSLGLKVTEVGAALEELINRPPRTIEVDSSRKFGHSHVVKLVV